MHVSARLRSLAFAVLLLVAAPAAGEVTRIEIAKRTPYLEGRVFEKVGAYERLRGRVTFAVDPAHAANRQVIDLELAPKNAQGKVEFSADIEILAPVDLAKANGALLYDVNNRGNKVAPGQFNGGADEFLFRKGYIVMWSGWIAETQPGGDRCRMEAPVASENGKPITGIVRAEVVVDAPEPRHTLGQWANQGTYEPTARGLENATLTWRQRESDPRVAIPREQWKLEQHFVETDGQRGQLPEINLAATGGLQPGYIYELIYEAQGPIVQGLGLAGIRDVVSYLKYDKSEGNPLKKTAGGSAAQVAYGFGVSQSGRCLRTFLYDGFNADEAGRMVFDGVMPHVAGAGMGFFNHRFASPTRHNTQHDNHLFPADAFPFAYGDDRDPLTGRIDGILRRARASKSVPKVMHTQSSSEYWHRSGSLVHTDPLGQRDATIPDEVRIYCFGGTQHGAGSGVPSPGGQGQLMRNPADYRPLVRGLLVALDAWVREGKEPPASVYPKIAEQSLVGWRQAESGWRAIPGVRYPEVIQQPELLDRGPDFLALRRTAIEPPVSRGHYVVKVPGYGPDDNELGTLELPFLSVPVATYTSWNLRNREAGAEGELWSLSGGYIPWAKTATERKERGDPRPALLERYENFAEYQEHIREAATQLAERRYILDEDIERLVKLAEKNRPLFE